MKESADREHEDKTQAVYECRVVLSMCFGIAAQENSAYNTWYDETLKKTKNKQ